MSILFIKIQLEGEEEKNKDDREEKQRRSDAGTHDGYHCNKSVSVSQMARRIQMEFKTPNRRDDLRTNPRKE